MKLKKYYEITDRVITHIPKTILEEKILVASSKNKDSKQKEIQELNIFNSNNLNNLEQDTNHELDSSLSSNDSVQTRKRKKKNKSNYDELNNKKRKLDNFLDTDDLLKDNNLNISEYS
ncbi:5401_t:CDS:2, partial [Scutellospora calospora]